MEIKPVRNLDNGRVELLYKKEISKKNIVKRHFSLPEDKVDEFTADFKKQSKNNFVYSLAGIILSSVLGVFLGGKVAKKSILSWAGAIAGGVAFAFGAISVAGRQIYKNQQKLFAKYDVKEMFYLKTNNSAQNQEQTKSQPAEQPEISSSKTLAGA